MTPVFFAAWGRFSDDDFVRLLKLAAVIAFRYSVVSALNPNLLERVCHFAAKAVIDGQANRPRAVFTQLRAMGNLTLLERTLNREVGNAGYVAKRAAYEKSAYALTRAVADLALEEWSPALLEERQRRLAARAVQLWRSDFA